MPTDTASICSKCHEANPERVYSNGYCKTCMRNRMRAWRVANPEKNKAAQLRSNFLRYGLTLEAWNEIFAAQSGCCAVCGVHQSQINYRLYVDHNHDTNKARGLLCRGCNTGIGAMKEDPEILDKAINYLLKHEGER